MTLLFGKRQNQVSLCGVFVSFCFLVCAPVLRLLLLLFSIFSLPNLSLNPHSPSLHTQLTQVNLQFVHLTGAPVFCVAGVAHSLAVELVSPPTATPQIITRQAVSTQNVTTQILATQNEMIFFRSACHMFAFGRVSHVRFSSPFSLIVIVMFKSLE